VFSANGLREGWFMQQVATEQRAEDPLLAAAHDIAANFGRSLLLPPSLTAWTAPLFPDETPQARTLREAACWMSDAGSHDHPEYRAEQAFFRILRQPAVALDHHARAFLALTLALRYEAEPDMPFLDAARMLLPMSSLRNAAILGMALRLAYTLCGGTVELLAGTTLSRDQDRLTLRLVNGTGVFAGEAVTRRLERLAQAAGLEAKTETT
jgi:exopolyphosphatase/guanosine-5'-triphosphate,3'-diphosphate pyrophosphatase